MDPSTIAALVVAGVACVGFAGNEMTHGGLSESMGLGHHHMLDYGGYHCADHDGAHGAQHMAHMHGNTTVAHDGCHGGHMMHGAR